MAYDLTTRNGYNMYDMSSMLQKAIRRADVKHAAYAAAELIGKYRKYLWKRLLTVSAEDCYGIMTQEIIALQQADEYTNNGTRGDNWIYVSKAVTLLCMARKNRDGDYVCCNFMCYDKPLSPEEIDEFDIGKATMDRIPDYVFDCHTKRGKYLGKTKLDMIRDEGEALEPHQINLFDNGDWGQFFDAEREAGRMSAKEELRYQEFSKDKKRY